ncbi:MAG: glycosyltransferase family 2 protein, partial [Bacteroidota bacterium]
LESAYPQVKPLDLKENWGFAEGYNRALKKVEAEYYVLLNSDVEVTEDWLAPLENFLDEHPEVGACQPKIRAYHQKTHFEYAGAAGGWLDKYGYPFCRGRLFDVIEADEGQFETPEPIFWATGACLVVRAELYHRLGGLDGDFFFAHMEEIDFCWRLQNAGHQLYFVPNSIIFHVGGGTLSVGSPFKMYLNLRNNLVMLHKNLPKERLFGTIFMRMVLDGVAGLTFILKGQWGYFRAVLHAHGFFYRNLKSLRKKRRQVQKLAPAQSPKKLHGWLDQSIVWHYFVRRRKTFSDVPKIKN